MKDLIIRLRVLEESDHDHAYIWNDACSDAADAIEELLAEHDKLRAALQAILDDKCMAIALDERLCDERPSPAQILAARIASLCREALGGAV